MSDPSATCWTVIEGAAAGREEDREDFARRYEPAVRAYLGARWRGSPMAAERDDAVQEVFFECFRGVLERADPNREGGFRALLYGVVRNVALRFEERRAKRREVQGSVDEQLPANERNLSDAFDLAWAESVMQQAKERQAEQAEDTGEDARRRVELLKLRFEEDLPIREIAKRWEADPAHLHHEYAKARREFKAALMDVVRFHHPGPDDEVEAECAHLLSIFS